MFGLAMTMVSAHEGHSAVQRLDAQSPVFSSRAELVVAHITVKDRRGAYVTALPQDVCRILEDGIPRRQQGFGLRG